MSQAPPPPEPGRPSAPAADNDDRPVSVDRPLTFDSPRLACRQHPADLWFAEAPEDLERAKAYCRPCPLADECLAGAVARSEQWGVWGGEILDHGVVVARKRPRGRPRKQPAPAAA